MKNQQRCVYLKFKRSESKLRRPSAISINFSSFPKTSEKQSDLTSSRVSRKRHFQLEHVEKDELVAHNLPFKSPRIIDSNKLLQFAQSSATSEAPLNSTANLSTKNTQICEITYESVSAECTKQPIMCNGAEMCEKSLSSDKNPQCESKIKGDVLNIDNYKLETQSESKMETNKQDDIADEEDEEFEYYKCCITGSAADGDEDSQYLASFFGVNIYDDGDDLEEDADKDQREEEDDSNDEYNWRNDYPDEEEDESSNDSESNEEDDSDDDNYYRNDWERDEDEDCDSENFNYDDFLSLKI